MPDMPGLVQVRTTPSVCLYVFALVNRGFPGTPSDPATHSGSIMSSGTVSTNEQRVSLSMVEKRPLKSPQYEDVTDTQIGESREIFQTQIDGVDFKTVSWQRATVVFVKIGFAMSILSIPGALASLGSVGGCLTIVGFTFLNTCELYWIQRLHGAKILTQKRVDTGLILGDYHNKHPECHSKID